MERCGAEFILLGCGTVQVCTAVMRCGYRIVEDMIDGLTNWMAEKNYAPSRILVGWWCKGDGVETPQPELQNRHHIERGEVHGI